MLQYRNIFTTLCSVLLLPAFLFAAPFNIPTHEQEKLFELDSRIPLRCYNGPQSNNTSLFGRFNSKKGLFIVLDGNAIRKLKRRFLEKFRELQNLDSSSLSKRQKKQKTRFKIFLRYLKRGPKICAQFEPGKTKDNTPPGSGENPEPTATPSPTTTPSPIPTPTPTPTPPGPFSGDAFSLSPYEKNDLSREECEHLFRKLMGISDPTLRNICFEQGLTAFVDAVFAYEAPNAPQGEPTPHTYNLEHPEQYRLVNGERTPFYLVGQNASEKHFEEHWLQHLVHGNPVREWVTYELTDWFSVQLSTFSNPSGDIHIHNIHPYFKLYHDNAVAEDEADPNVGSFRNLAKQQVWNSAMQSWLDNKTNCSNGGALANENFARELLELFILGTRDLWGVQNYDEDTVVEAARATSGYYTAWTGETTTFNFYACRPFPGNKTIFSNSPFGENVEFTISDVDLSTHYNHLVDGTLDGHPQSSRYIAGQFFTRLVHQSLGANAASDRLLAQASDLLTNLHGYNIGRYVKTLLLSEAMFSEEARYSGIAAAAHPMIRMTRLLHLPLVDRGWSVRLQWVECSVNDSDPYCSDPRGLQNGKQYRPVRRADGSVVPDTQYAGKIPSVLRALRDALAKGGDQPGQPASVFGREGTGSGVWRGAQISKGHDAITPQFLLQRINEFSDVLRAVKPTEILNIDQQFWHDPSNETPFSLLDVLPNADMAPGNIIQYFSDLFDVPLSTAETNVLVNYLDSNFGNLSAAEKEIRLRGVVLLFLQHPLFTLT